MVSHVICTSVTNYKKARQPILGKATVAYLHIWYFIWTPNKNIKQQLFGSVI